MIDNTYQDLKAYIFGKLKRHNGALPKDKIQEEIENVKSILGQIGADVFARLISAEIITELTDADWQRMQRELETHFDVKMDLGVLIQGSEQQKRDTTWWTSIHKQRRINYYWNRYKAYLEESLPLQVVNALDDDTDIVMNNIEDPSVKEFSRYGMVVGHVQSGKTGNYSGLICKAADAGYKFIVVIAGGLNNLRNQTQERLNESFTGQTNGTQVGAGKGNTDRVSTPLSLTTIQRDFNKQDADRLSQGLNFDNISVPVLLVIKKNTRTLESVITWLEKQYKNNVSDHAMLVIDDESDYASINTNEEENPTAINKGIRKLLGLFSRSSYVAYTATPYANIFIDHEASNEDYGRDLFPKDFIYALEAPTNYFGARKIFLETDNHHLIPVDDSEDFIPVSHKKDFDPEYLPPSLYEATRVFILNIAVRALRGAGPVHNSMLIHATRFTDVHKKIATLIRKYNDKLGEEITAFGMLEGGRSQSSYLNDLYQTYVKYYNQQEFPWLQVQNKLTDSGLLPVVREVHQRSGIPLEYRKDVPTNAVVVGGTSLSRGYTLEGLSVSYFLRNTVFYDTLMQMGRWFGYRAGYEDLCRIYMPEQRILDFADIISATEDLMNDFRLMAEHKRTPNDFGLAVRENPDSALQVTARNKQRNVREFFFSMRLDGKAKETSVLRNDINEIDFNTNTIRDLVESLPGSPDYSGKNLIWHDIDRLLISSFLDKFKTYSTDPLGISNRMPISFIKQYAKEKNTAWDVAFYSGEGESFIINRELKINKENRKIVIRNGNFELKNRQISSGNAESIALSPENRKAVGDDRIHARQLMIRPLLMLHILQPSIDNEQMFSDELPAFGVSFPGDALSDTETVRLKINTVYYQNLLNDLEGGDESDD